MIVQAKEITIMKFVLLMVFAIGIGQGVTVEAAKSDTVEVENLNFWRQHGFRSIQQAIDDQAFSLLSLANWSRVHRQTFFYSGPLKIVSTNFTSQQQLTRYFAKW